MARVGGATSKLDGLNEMQRAFASNYAASFNGAQAAIAAGYAKKSAEVQAYRLLRMIRCKLICAAFAKRCATKGCIHWKNTSLTSSPQPILAET